MDVQSLTLLGWLAIGGVFLFAGLVHGTLGMGFPMLATPLLAIAIDMRSAILLTLLPTITVNLISILRGGRWSESIGRHWPLAVVIPLGTAIGTWLLIIGDPAPFGLLLAAIILLHLLGDRVNSLSFSWVTTHPGTGYLVFGFASGLASGTVNIMVPLLIIFALQVGMTPLIMVQVFNLCFLVGKVVQTLVFSYSGIVSSAQLVSTLPFAGISAVALVMGMLIRERVDARTYRNWLHKVLVLMVIILTAQFIWWMIDSP
ncbi:MAG: sulfite exporter TauE/SafE family protein [Gammaproteobacteria bacterium]|nr:sulfite exporter TauE/SafE family protein [Gammaproteobacteria bacterium]